MKHDISVSSKFCDTSKYQLSIGTHSGIFHEDEVVSCALLCIKNFEKSINIVRSRDLDELSKCNLVVDIGGGQFDHHQVGGNGKRENSIPFASAGLVWKHFGKEIIKFLASMFLNISITEEEINVIFSSFDVNIIQEIDKIDNGITANMTPLSFITAYLPSWRTVFDSSVYDTAFQSVLEVSISVIKHLILTEIDKFSSYYYLLNQYKKNVNGRMLEIPSQTFPWLEAVTSINQVYNGHIDFVIFEYPSGGWAAQCVPPCLEEKFKQRISFPKSWAGQTTELSKISGINDATFCHNGLFFVRAKTKESIINMCNVAINK